MEIEYFFCLFKQLPLVTVSWHLKMFTVKKKHLKIKSMRYIMRLG